VEFPCKPTEAPESGRIIINWSNVESSGALTPYQSEVNAIVTPFLGRIHADIESLNEEVETVANNIKTAAELTLPTVHSGRKGKKTHFFKDSTLKFLCERSKSAWKAWCDAGRPQSGPLFESKNGLRREVKKRVNLCAAVDERKCIRRREMMFKRKDNRRTPPDEIQML